MSDYVRPAYENDFSDAVHLIGNAVENWAQNSASGEPFIDGFADCVFLKRSNHLIAFANLAFKNFYVDVLSNAKTVDSELLDQATLGISQKSDELLLSSGRSLEFEHVSVGPSGIQYNVKTHKRWLPSNRHGLTILGITRVLSVVERLPLPSAERLAALALKYEALESDDRVLCCLMAAGHSQREMAEMLGCTTRTIENRRNRIMDQLGATKPIEIVKLMVRLAEHGLIQADF